VNAVRAELAHLEERGMVLSNVDGNRKYFRLNKSCMGIGELTPLVHRMKDGGYAEFDFPDFARASQLSANLEHIVEDIVAHYNPEKIILFGSLAKGNVQEFSDIDLVIIKKTDKPFYDRLREVATLCSYDVGVDFLVYTPEEYAQLTRAKGFVRDEIIKKGKVLYAKAA
jgi:predicted nucleotidyltransferase